MSYLFLEFWLGMLLLGLTLPVLLRFHWVITASEARRLARLLVAGAVLTFSLTWPMWDLFRHGFSLPPLNPAQHQVFLLLILSFILLGFFLLIHRARLVEMFHLAQGNLHWGVTARRWLSVMRLYQPERALLQCLEWGLGSFLLIYLWSKSVHRDLNASLWLMSFTYYMLFSLARWVQGFQVVITSEGVQADSSLFLPWAEFYGVEGYPEQGLVILRRRPLPGWGDVLLVAPNEAFARRAMAQAQAWVVKPEPRERITLERRRRRALVLLRAGVWLWVGISGAFLVGGWVFEGLALLVLGAMLIRILLLIALQPRVVRTDGPNP